MVTSSKLQPCLLKQPLKTQKLKRIMSYVSKCNLHLYFWHNKSCWFPVKKCWCQQKSRSVWHELYICWIYFRYKCDKLHCCRICVTDFRVGGLLAPHPRADTKRPILGRVKSKNKRRDKVNKVDAISGLVFCMNWGRFLLLFFVLYFLLLFTFLCF